MNYAVNTNLMEEILSLVPISVSSEVDKYLQYLPLLIIGFVITLLVTPILGKIAWKYKITYLPKAKRAGKDFDNPEKAIHDYETPSLGGLGITVPALILLLIGFQLNAFTIPILVALLILIVGALIDDITNLDSKYQFGYQMLACLVIVLSVIDLETVSFIGDELINLSMYALRFNILSIPISIVFPGDIILFFWLMLCINAVKWVGGSPALLEGNSTIIFSLLFLVGVRTFSTITSSVSILLVGSLLAFLIYAFPPQKIFSGPSGRTLFGFMIAILALISGAKFSISIMLLAIPLIDAVFVVIRRMIVHKPKNLVALMKINDATHLHHQLLKLNLSKTQVLLVEASMTLLIGAVAIATTGAIKYFAFIFILAFTLILIVFINIRASKKDFKKKEESPESKYSY